MIVRCTVLSILRAVLIFLRSAISRVVIFGRENVGSAATSLGWYSRVSTVLTRLSKRKVYRYDYSQDKFYTSCLDRLCTIDWDPERLWAEALVGCPTGGPIVPECPFPWWGKVWNCIALLGSISSRNPNKWKVAYGQISSSMPATSIEGRLCCHEVRIRDTFVLFVTKFYDYYFHVW